MRLAVYIRSVKTARGAERTVATVAGGLAARGHAVDLLVEEAEGGILEELARAEHAVRVVRLRDEEAPAAPRAGGPLRRLRRRFVQLRAGLRALRGRQPGARGTLRMLLRLVWGDDPPLPELLRYVASERPDAVLSFLNYPNFVLCLAACLAPGQTRYLVNVRNHVSTSATNARSRWNRSIPCLMRLLFRFADGVVAPSQGVADDVAHITGLASGRIRVIHNPVFRPELLERSLEPPRHPWLENGAVPVLVAAGKLKPQKDFATLLRAFAEVRRQRMARLLILGEGGERDRLVSLAEDLGVARDTALVGYVENPAPFFRRASLFVLSSAWEGFPNVLVEAMACGCPVVSTDCPSGPAEILSGGSVGRLVPVGDVGAMARAILEALDAPSPRERFVDAAQRFSFATSIEAYEAFMTPPGRTGAAETQRRRADGPGRRDGAGSAPASASPSA